MEVEERRRQSPLCVLLNEVVVDCLALTLRLFDLLSLPASSMFHLVLKPSISQGSPNTEYTACGASLARSLA